MFRVLHCTIGRYINSTREDDARAEVEAFLLAVFDSMEVQKVLRAGIAWPAAEASHALSQQMLIHIEPLATPELLARIRGQDLTMEMCAGARTFGINFDIEQRSYSSGATLYYRFGPLPVVEFDVLYFVDQKSPKEWAEMLVASKTVDVVYTLTHWLRREGCYGGGDSRYLLWKRTRLFREPKASISAVQAGRVLRDLCNGVWNDPKRGLAKLEATGWWWSKRRFIKEFDTALVEHVGVEALNGIFKAMGTTVDQWLET
jgi:hypothetical protein